MAKRTDEPCSIDDCTRRHYARGLCEAHYARVRRHGGTHDKRAERSDPHQRFRARVDTSADCWLWRGPVNSSGYGSFYLNGRPIGAHVAAVLLDGREVPSGKQVDHICNTPRCVRADHLRVVERDLNWRRSDGLSARHARKTRCDSGHDFTPENTYRDKRGNRSCRACAADYQRRRRARLRAT